MESDLGKLFIGGISWDTNEDRLKEYFETYGEIVEAVIMKDRTTGRARGFGFVVFTDPTVAERVVMEKHQIDGRTPGMESDLGKLFIGGISWDTNEDRLKEYFETYGEIVEAVIMKDRTTGRARGFGFVVFTDPTVAERVVMEKHQIDGRTVEAKKAVPRDDQHISGRNNNNIHGSPVPTRTKKIFVGGLASTVTESDFKLYFEQFGKITDVVVMYDHNNQRPRGFGFITYESEDSVDKVLQKTFHELNGKMVEGKRAVPKELSPGPSRSPLGGYNNYGLTRVNSLLNSYSQGFGPSLVGGYGVRMDGRFSPVAGSRGGFPPFGPPSYGLGMNFEPGLNSSYGGTANFGANIGYGQGLNPYYNGNSNRYASSIGFGGGNGGSGSLLSPTTRIAWGNGGLGYSSNSSSSHSFMGSGNSNLGAGSFGNSGTNWSSSPISAQGGGNASNFSSGNFGYGNGDSSYGLGGGYSRNNGSAFGPTQSFNSSNGGYGEFFGGGSVYGDPTWRSATSELDESGSFGYGMGNAASDVNHVTAKGSASFVGGYIVTNRQPNRGEWGFFCFIV